MWIRTLPYTMTGIALLCSACTDDASPVQLVRAEESLTEVPNLVNVADDFGAVLFDDSVFLPHYDPNVADTETDPSMHPAWLSNPVIADPVSQDGEPLRSWYASTFAFDTHGSLSQHWRHFQATTCVVQRALNALGASAHQAVNEHRLIVPEDEEAAGCEGFGDRIQETELSVYLTVTRYQVEEKAFEGLPPEQINNVYDWRIDVAFELDAPAALSILFGQDIYRDALTQEFVYSTSDFLIHQYMPGGTGEMARQRLAVRMRKGAVRDGDAVHEVPMQIAFEFASGSESEQNDFYRFTVDMERGESFAVGFSNRRGDQFIAMGPATRRGSRIPVALSVRTGGNADNTDYVPPSQEPYSICIDTETGTALDMDWPCGYEGVHRPDDAEVLWSRWSTNELTAHAFDYSSAFRLRFQGADAQTAAFDASPLRGSRGERPPSVEELQSHLNGTALGAYTTNLQRLEGESTAHFIARRLGTVAIRRWAEHHGISPESVAAFEVGSETNSSWITSDLLPSLGLSKAEQASAAAEIWPFFVGAYEDLALTLYPNRVAIALLATLEGISFPEAQAIWTQSAVARSVAGRRGRPTFDDVVRHAAQPAAEIFSAVQAVRLDLTRRRFELRPDQVAAPLDPDSSGTTTVAGEPAGPCPGLDTFDGCELWGIDGMPDIPGMSGPDPNPIASDPLMVPMEVPPWMNPDSPCYGIDPNRIMNTAGDDSPFSGSEYDDAHDWLDAAPSAPDGVADLIQQGFGRTANVVYTMTKAVLTELYDIAVEAVKDITADAPAGMQTYEIAKREDFGKVDNSQANRGRNQWDIHQRIPVPQQRPDPTSEELDACREDIANVLDGCGFGSPTVPFDPSLCEFSYAGDCSDDDPNCWAMKCECSGGAGESCEFNSQTSPTASGGVMVTATVSCEAAEGSSDECGTLEVFTTSTGGGETPPAPTLSSLGLCECDPECAYNRVSLPGDDSIDCSGCEVPSDDESTAADLCWGENVPPGLVQLCGVIDPPRM